LLSDDDEAEIQVDEHGQIVNLPIAVIAVSE
jgi:hypothetical protein